MRRRQHKDRDIHKMSKATIATEFSRQLQNLIKKGYPKLAGISEDIFAEKVKKLQHKLNSLDLPEIDLAKGTLPFVIVVKSDLVASETQMEKVEKNGLFGVTILRPHTSENFKVIESVEVPQSEIYLLIGVDRGKSNINLPPAEALKLITDQRRSPLTIEEGIAIVTHFPEFLIKNNCFSLLASRTGTDKRVPAIWINAKKQPNLGWCWDGNPHTWLGSASCINRL